MIFTSSIPRIPKRATVYATGKGGTVFMYGSRFWLSDNTKAVAYTETGVPAAWLKAVIG